MSLPHLPPEVWIKIFKQSLVSDPDDITNKFSLAAVENDFPIEDWQAFYYELITTPYEISRVCRLWRSIITDLPEVWSSFILECSPTGAGQNIVPLIKLYLERSKDWGLRVHIYSDYFEDRPEYVNDHNYFAAASFLMQHRDRFQDFSLHMSNQAFNYFSWGPYLPEHPIFPNLERVKLGGYGEWAAPAWLWEGIKNAPRLQKVSLTGVRLSSHLSDALLADSPITELEIRNISHTLERRFQDFRIFLPTLRKMETLKITDCYEPGYQSLETPLSPPLKSDSLRNLIIEENDKPHNLFLSLDLPSLQSLTLSGSKRVFMLPQEVSRLFSILSRFTSLRHLVLHINLNRKQNNDPKQLTEFVEKLPNLTALDVTIRGGGGGCSYMLLIALASAPSLGRRLHRLYLSETECLPDFDLLNLFLDTLEIRVGASRRIETRNSHEGVLPAELTDVTLILGSLTSEISESQIEYLRGKLWGLRAGTLNPPAKYRISTESTLGKDRSGHREVKLDAADVLNEQ
ncbi:hypothetical protein L218DRAFT_1082110 [Marasmius fiardii PR-910]|nr:hypothetical protein L218DRAFT_1082110 [Marasmius fiardii PR-910]